MCQDDNCGFQTTPRYHSHHFTFGKDKKNCPNAMANVKLDHKHLKPNLVRIRNVFITPTYVKIADIKTTKTCIKIKISGC